MTMTGKLAWAAPHSTEQGAQKETEHSHTHAHTHAHTNSVVLISMEFERESLAVPTFSVRRVGGLEVCVCVCVRSEDQIKEDQKYFCCDADSLTHLSQVILSLSLSAVLRPNVPGPQLIPAYSTSVVSLSFCLTLSSDSCHLPNVTSSIPRCSLSFSLSLNYQKALFQYIP